MADWIDEVDRIDKSLHRLGVPAAVRMKATAEIMDILARAEKAKRDRAQLVLEAVNACKGDVRKAAREVGWSKSTCYAELQNRSKVA
jgi:DNA-binding NtrC family response regulator